MAAVIHRNERNAAGNREKIVQSCPPLTHFCECYYQEMYSQIFEWDILKHKLNPPR